MCVCVCLPPAWREGCFLGGPSGLWSHTPQSGCNSGRWRDRKETLGSENRETAKGRARQSPADQPSHQETDLSRRTQSNTQTETRPGPEGLKDVQVWVLEQLCVHFFPHKTVDHVLRSQWVLVTLSGPQHCANTRNQNPT